MRLAAIFFILFSFKAAIAQELTFSQVYASKIMGIDRLSGEEREALFAKARGYASYRRNPQSVAANEFVDTCTADPKASVLCELLFNSSKPLPRPGAPAEIRSKLNAALLSLDNPKERSKNCAQALKIFEPIINDPALYTYHTRALYWSWVCANATKESELARSIKERLWSRFPLSHHTNRVLSADKDTRIDSILMRETDWPVSLRSQRALELNGWIEAIEALQKINEDGAAAVAGLYINQRLRELEPEVRLYFAVLMSQVSESIPSVLPVSRVLVPLFVEYPQYIAPATLRLLFPINYSFEKVAQEKSGIVELVNDFRGNLDAGLLIGLIHQESALNPRAASGAGAFGLMQLLIPTATDQYRRLTRTPTAKVDRDMLFQPRLNVQLGILDFRWRLAQFKNDLILTLASYNAGVAGVQKWMRETKSLQTPELLADVLFLNRPQEFHVSQYVTMILSRAEWYRRLYPQLKAVDVRRP
jgi:soluble lytic murein transglycosylase-like protein